MKTEPEQRLKALFQDWQTKIDLPPRFEPEVWRRIALAQEKRSEFWSFEWLIRMTCQPKLAFAIVATAVLMGTGLAKWEAQQNYHRDMAASESRYIHSVDPLSNALLTSNP